MDSKVDFELSKRLLTDLHNDLMERIKISVTHPIQEWEIDILNRLRDNTLSRLEAGKTK